MNNIIKIQIMKYKNKNYYNDENNTNSTNKNSK